MLILVTPFWVAGAAESMEIGKFVIEASNKSGRRCKRSDELQLTIVLENFGFRKLGDSFEFAALHTGIHCYMYGCHILDARSSRYFASVYKRKRPCTLGLVEVIKE